MPPNQVLFMLYFNEAQVNRVLQILQKQPYVKVFDLINEIEAAGKRIQQQLEERRMKELADTFQSQTQGVEQQHASQRR